MQKRVEIGGQKYTLSNSVGVFLRYKNIFGKSLLEDAKQADEITSLKILYAMVTPSLASRMSLEEFADSISITELQSIMDTVGEMLNEAFPKEESEKN